MNVIKLCGGLGNQIFQYAFGKAQMQNGIDVKFDPSWYDSKNAANPLRTYVLDKFNTTVEFSKPFEKKKIVSEKGFDLSLLNKDGFYFSGYWQYPEYYNSVLSVLKSELRIKKELYTQAYLDLREEIIMNDKSIALHVRRGDYLHLEGFPVLDLDYYKKALKKVDGDLYVFSDDMDWCWNKFPGAHHVHLNEYFDFELMKLCKHQVLSRSSYGWWAAHLNNNENKIVVVPKQQLDCKVRKQSASYGKDVYDPKEWVRC